MAENYKVHVERIYCGSAEHLKDYAGELHSFAQELAYLPVVSSTTDFCAYVAEGDSANTVLYGALSLAEILSLGSASFVKSGGRLVLGAGIERASTVSSAGVKIGSKYVRDASDAANLILNAERKSTAATKTDQYHYAATFLSKEQMSSGKVYAIDDGKSILLQVEGGLNGKNGIFEYILESDGKVSHQSFKESAGYSGKPN